jgi:hypothetical protein
MASEIGATLIGLGAAAIGVIGIVVDVYLTAKAHPGPAETGVVAAVIGDYLKAAAGTAVCCGVLSGP